MLWHKRKVLKQADGIPDYHKGPVYDGSGAADLVFNAEFGLPVYLARGAGRVAGSLRVTQHPQVRFNQQAPVSGLGGTVAGQLVGQQLVRLEDIE